MLTTSQNILKLLSQYDKLRPADIVEYLGISRQQVQLQLGKLLKSKKVTKIGSSPKVYYALAKPQITNSRLTDFQREFLEQKYLYVSPKGEFKWGEPGFADWLNNTKQKQPIEKLAAEFIKVRQKIDQTYGKEHLITGTKINNDFEEDYLNKVYFSDYYSIPQFGKTPLGQMMFYAKQAQNRELTDKIATQIAKDILGIIALEKIDCIAYIPPSVPRKMQFMRRLATGLSLDIDEVKLEKQYSGSIIIAQKTLKTSAERILNARETIIISGKQTTKIAGASILIIDDASGSGATLNEVAGKLKAAGAKRICGYAIVGSLNGFEVITEA